MNDFLESISAFFTGIGMHPVLGSFLLGILFSTVFLRRRAQSGITIDLDSASRSAASLGSVGSSFKSTVVHTVRKGEVVVNGQTIQLTDEDIGTLTGLIAQGNIIGAIKKLREVTGLGLTEAKGVVEGLSRIEPPK